MKITLLDAMSDARLFAPWFTGASWDPWRAALAALLSLPMTDEQRAFALLHTGRSRLPAAPCSEAWLCCGRRAGKSLIAALLCIFLALFKDYTQFLAPGEVATVMLLACDKRQARTVMRYAKGFIRQIPALESRVTRWTHDAIEFGGNRTVIEIHATSPANTRGYSLAGVILEEQALWPSGDVAEPDAEVIDALRPGMMTIPGSLLLGISTPHARTGEFFRASQAHFGNDDSPVLFWNASSLAMNPRLDARIIDAAFERDPIVAAAEYGHDGFVEFRSDVESFISAEVLQGSVNTDRPLILPPMGVAA